MRKGGRGSKQSTGVKGISKKRISVAGKKGCQREMPKKELRKRWLRRTKKIVGDANGGKKERGIRRGTQERRMDGRREKGSGRGVTEMTRIVPYLRTRALHSRAAAAHVWMRGKGGEKGERENERESFGASLRRYRKLPRGGSREHRAL